MLRDPPRCAMLGRDDRGVNEILGTILLMAIAVGLVGAFILVLFSMPGPQPTSHTEVQAFIVPTAQDQLVLEHRGGPAIPISSLVALVSVNGTSTSYVVGDHIGGSWSVTDTDGNVKSASGSFSLGDQAKFTSATLYKASASVTIVDRNAEALTLGATLLRNTDATPPTFQGSRTATTTTVIANFTEALRSILAADFTVGGVTPSSATLLGNGSSAEFTVAAPFATDATPQVASIATPTGSFDLGGNAFTGSATTTPVDGVAPAISVGPTASPTTSSATITWTTPESGTTAVRYGPTPSDLGLSATGPSGTAHSASLVGLTDNFRYYYEVTTTDAAGSSVTSAAGSFVTSTTGGGGGGGGSGDAVPYHFVINQTFSPITSGTASDISTPFRVALRNATDATVTATSAVTVTLTTNSTVGYFLNNAGALLDVQTFQIPIGQSFAEFRYIDHRDGGYSVLGATSANITPAFTTVQVSGNTGRGMPLRLEFSTQDTVQASGTATSDLQISVRDVYDNLVEAPYSIQVNLSTNSTSGFFQSGAGPISAITIGPGSTTTTAFTYVDHRAAGTASLLMANAQGMTPATMQMTSEAGTTSTFAVGNRLEFTAVPTGSLTSGTPTSVNYIVTLKDAAGRAITPDTNVIVRLATNSSFGHFLDPDGTTAITTRTLTTSNGTAWFKYVDFRSNGTSLLMASSNGTLPGSVLAPVVGRSVAGAMDHLVFSASVATNASGIVSGPFQLQLRDALNQQTTAPSTLTVTLLTNSTSGFFCADASCAARATTTTVASGSALSSTFWYVDYRFSATSALLASAPKVTPALVSFGVTGGTPPFDHLSWTTAPTSMTAGSIAGPYVITLRDHLGLARVTPSPVPLTLETNSSWGVFCADASCATSITRINVTAGGSTTPSLYYRDARGSSMALVTAQGDRITGASIVIAVTGGANLTGISSNHLAFTTSVSSGAAGTVLGPYQLTMRDPLGVAANSLSGDVITLMTNSSNGVFCTSATCTTIITQTNISAAASTSSTFYYRDSRANSMATLVASSPRIIPGSAVVAITGGTPYGRYLEITGGPGAALDAGIATPTAYTLTLKDMVGTTTAAGGSGIMVTLETNSTLGTFLDATSGAPISTLTFAASESSKTFKYVDNRTSGTSILTARAQNIIPAAVVASMNSRGIAAESGDHMDSIRVFTNVPNDVDNNRGGVIVSITVVNPTPSSFVIDRAVFDASQAPTVVNFFNSLPATAAGANAQWACTWTRAVSNNHATCDTVDFTLGPYGVTQLVFSFTSSGSTNARTVVNSTIVFTNGTIRSGPDNIFVDATNDAAQLRLFALNGTDPVQVFHGFTAGTQQDLPFSVRLVAAGTVYSTITRIAIPAGWSNVSVNAHSRSLSEVVAIRQPTGLQPGLVVVTSEQSGGDTFDFTLRATLPVMTTPGYQLIEAEVSGTGSSRSTPFSFVTFIVQVTS